VSRRRGLTPEEEALWRRVVRDVVPSRTVKPHNAKLVSPAKSDPKPPPGIAPARRHSVSAPSGGLARPPAASPRRLEHPFAAGDPRLDKLAARGRLAIDATLDLHGHTQRTARAVLQRFIAEGHARGARCLLVITGKGAPEFARGLDRGAGSGVLRARLADWIGEEPVRKFVSRASSAHQRHGGAGAFYVFLKRS
jgi:DNA-nicking Smr family endonuclease